MKTLWYTGCSMTRGDEIADQILDPDFFDCELWNDKFDYSSPIKEKMGNSWKSKPRKDRRLARLHKVAMMGESNPLNFEKTIFNFLNELREKEQELSWPSQIAKKLGYDCIHDAESAASPGVEFYRLLKDLNNERDVRIIAWTYPFRLTYWGKTKFLKYPPGWQPMHINRTTDDDMTREFFDRCFDNQATANEWIESVVLSAEILSKIGKPWYFTFGNNFHLETITKYFPNFSKYINKYDNHILSYTVFDDQYSVTEHLTPRAMYAGHPRLESHNILADKFFKKIKNDINNQ